MRPVDCTLYCVYAESTQGFFVQDGGLTVLADLGQQEEFMAQKLVVRLTSLLAANGMCHKH